MATRRVALMRPSQIFDSFMDEFFNTPNYGFGKSTVDIDMFEDADTIVIKVKSPGIKPEDLDITIEDTVLTISYQTNTKKEEQDEKKKYYYKEIREESFSRSVTLPTRVAAEKAGATSEDGIVTITVPKLEEVKPKKVSIATTKK